MEEKIFSVCGSQNFDDGLSSLQEKMSSAQEWDTASLYWLKFNMISNNIFDTSQMMKMVWMLWDKVLHTKYARFDRHSWNSMHVMGNSSKVMLNGSYGMQNKKWNI